MNTKALMKLMARYRVEAVHADGCEGIAVVDTAGDPLVVTALLFDESGMPVAGRHYAPAARANLGAAELLDGATRTMGETMPLSAVLDFFGLRGRRAAFARDVATSFLVTPEGQGADRSKVEDAAISLLKAEGVDAVSALLHPEAVEALACVDQFQRSAYAFYAQPGDIGMVRRQAAASYPLLAGDIASKLLVKMAVDRKQPLVEVLMKAYGADEVGNPRMSRGLLKKLTGRRLSDGGLPTQTIVNALSEIPVDWFPKDDEWDNFLDIVDSFFRRLAPEIGVKAGSMAAGVGGKWHDFANRLGRSYAWGQPPQDLDEEQKKQWTPIIDVSRIAMVDAAENTREMIQAFRNYVLLPLAANAGHGIPVFVGPEQLRHAADLSAQLLFGGKSLTNVLETQRHWHTQAHNIRNAAQQNKVSTSLKEVAADGWAPLCDMVVAPNGVHIVPLTDPRELEDEGKGWPNDPAPDRNGILGLAHCVHTHEGDCRSGARHIVSLRLPMADGRFERLSTAEFYALKPESLELVKSQHYGVRNTTPKALSQEAYDWFVKSVAERQIPVNHNGIMAYLAGRRRVAEEVESYCDYDWREDADIAEALDPWRPYLPKRLRDLDVQGLQALPELRDLVQALAPSYGFSASVPA